MKTFSIDVTKTPTEEQIKMLEAAADRPICFDEDSPELSEDDLMRFRRIANQRKDERRKQVVTLRVSPTTLAKAKALGSGYSGVLSRMLDFCLDNPDIIKQCL